MEPGENLDLERKKNKLDNITDKMIDKAEDFMDETAKKIIKSEGYKKAGDTVEKAAIDIFRKAGRWWGKQ